MRKPKYTSFDRFVSVIAVIVVIVIYFIEKTKLAAILSGALIFTVAFLPLWNAKYILGSRTRQVISSILLFCCVVVWVYFNGFVEGQPVSDIRVQDVTVGPLDSQMRPSLRLGLFNDNFSTLHYYHQDLCAIGVGSIPSNQFLEDKETEYWQKLEDSVQKDRENLSSEKFYVGQLPPKVRTWTTISCGSMNPDQAKGFNAANGSVAVFYMSIFLYKDGSKEKGLENCLVTQGAGVLVHCSIGHVGPRKPKEI